MAVRAWTCVQAEQAQATQRPECSREVDQNNNGDRQGTLIYLSYLLSISETIHRGPIVPDGSHRCRLPTNPRGRALLMPLDPRFSAQKKSKEAKRKNERKYSVFTYFWDSLPMSRTAPYNHRRIADRFFAANPRLTGPDFCQAIRVAPSFARFVRASATSSFSPLGPAGCL